MIVPWFLMLAVQAASGAPTLAVPAIAAPPATSGVVDWRDVPLAPGRWTYRSVPGGSEAVWSDPSGKALFRLSCTLPARQVLITRAGALGPLTVHTTGVTRMLSGPSLAANDPLLDQMAFSRGRFAIAVTGMPLLVVPSWAEPARLIEDCRR